jgi:hypothetical protein
MREVSPPSFKCFLALNQEVVSLVYGRNAWDRAGLMIEEFVCHVRRNAQPGHPRHAGPA